MTTATVISTRLVMVALLLFPTCAFVFPILSSLSDEWEPVEQYHERINVTFNYQPVHIHPEYCRYITQETCRKDDEAAARSMEQKRQRRLNPKRWSFTFLVLLIQFTDHQDRVLTPKEYYEEFCNGSGPSVINPVGCISQ
jgi:hypothetical protein